ncbi:MAG: DUF1824 family protein [Drouetiella hepatica Uher 2000/2452]|uniref:DUF1824 family protein n=1 Tax=Drouetiella hepatica Uher 2000/2452 TaxID=904376 RepID=A0A951QF66_9CYAN|nr:DUF1824 family protein [Drouetiella hepatica Uher 2000/2452]
MSDPHLSEFAVEAAHKLLKQFEGVGEQQAVEEQTSSQLLRERLREAVAIVSSHSDYQILGVCADTLAEGCRALRAYAAALGYSPNLDLRAIEGSAYIKFNPQGSCYAESYSGHHRGVLVSCQSAASGLNEMYGHLPLDLFEPE